MAFGSPGLSEALEKREFACSEKSAVPFWFCLSTWFSDLASLPCPLLPPSVEWSPGQGAGVSQQDCSFRFPNRQLPKCRKHPYVFPINSSHHHTQPQRAVPRCFQHLLIKTWPPAQPGWVDELCPQPPFTDGFQSLKPAGVGG